MSSRRVTSPPDDNLLDSLFDNVRLLRGRDDPADAIPNSLGQSEVAAPLGVFAPVPSAEPDVPVAPHLAGNAAGRVPLIGVAVMADSSNSQGDIRRGRDFAFGNCRPCPVVAPNQSSATRFSNAPDFRAIANMQTTTQLSLINAERSAAAVD